MSGLSIIQFIFFPKDRGIKTLKVVDGALSFWEDELIMAYIKPILIEKHFWLDEYEWSEDLEKFCLQHNIGIY